MVERDDDNDVRYESHNCFDKKKKNFENLPQCLDETVTIQERTLPKTILESITVDDDIREFTTVDERDHLVHCTDEDRN